MYCKKCGKQIEDGAAFCPKCGTPTQANASALKEEKGRKTTGRKQIAIGAAAAVAVIVLMVVIFSGKKDGYSGYYTCVTAMNYYAIQIDGDKITGYGSGTLPYHEGYLSTAENCAYANFNDADWSRYNSFTITLSDNGGKMFFSSESPQWSTDIYDAVSKSEYEAFLREHLADEVEEHRNAE